jgi:predicted acyl esterase
MRLIAAAERQLLAAKEKADKYELDRQRQVQLSKEKSDALERDRDHLGGTRHPWMHSVVRYSLNKLFGFQQWEPGMEEQYREVLCREMVTMQTDMHIPAELVDPDCTLPPLLLEMSHFYPQGCHNTPLPVIIVRTPYDRALMRHTAERICQHGYHVIIQDTRNSPNAAAMRAKADLAKVAAAKNQKLVDQEAEAIRRKYQAKSPKMSQRTAADGATTIQPLTLATAGSTGDASSTVPASTSTPSSNVTLTAPTIVDPIQLPATTATAADGSTAASTPTSSALPSLTSSPQEFFPIVHESTDGYATIDWVSKQPWCDGNVSFYGASYLGIAQYAVVDHKHPALKCIVPVASASRVYPILFPEPGTLNLDLAARWLFIMFHPSVTGPSQTEGVVGSSAEPVVVPSFWKRSYARVIGSRSVIPKALNHLPASELDRLVTEKTLSFYQEMIRNGHDESLPFWREKQVKLCDLANSPPLLIVEGWYDLFLQQALRDYVEALQIYKSHQVDIAEGKYTEEELAKMPSSVRTFKPYLTIINCVHIDFKQLYRISLIESIQWFDFHLKPNKSHSLIDRPAEKSVRVQMINASGVNEQRHLGLIAKRKKAEKALASGSSVPDSSLPADPALADLLSPRSKTRWRQNLLDAEWRFFSEFPPPSARSVKYYLYCDVDEKGVEHRVLRTDAPGERERLEKIAVKYFEEAKMRAMIASLSAPTHDTMNAEKSKDGAVSIGATSANSSSSAAVAVASGALAAATPTAIRSLPNLSIAIPSAMPELSLIPILPTQPYSCFTYDPKDPTPSIGGTSFDVENSGPMDVRSMESRSDVLVFTSAPLVAPLTVIGFVHCMLYVRSNVPCTDFVARLCDVYPIDEWSTSADRKAGSGKSQILCDGLFKVTPTKIDALTVEKGTTTSKSPQARPMRTISMEKRADFVQLHLHPAPLVQSSPSSATADLVTISITPSPASSAGDFALPFFPISAPDPTTPLLKLDIDMVRFTHSAECDEPSPFVRTSCSHLLLALSGCSRASLSGRRVTCFRSVIAFAFRSAPPLIHVGCAHSAVRIRCSSDWNTRSCNIRRYTTITTSLQHSYCRYYQNKREGCERGWRFALAQNL